MRKKQILHVVEGRVMLDEQRKKPPEIKVSRNNHRETRQREWDLGTLDSESLQHFNSI